MLSVIMPTYHRPKTLLQALQSLQEQTLSEFEIFVVDNAADSKIAEMIKEFNQKAKIPARYIPEPKPGVHNARHTGVRASRSEILIFTDDDATFHPGWLQAYANAFRLHPEMVAAGGPVQPTWEVPPPQWLLDYMGDSKVFGILSLMEPYQEFRLDPKVFFFSVNMATRRLVFEWTGFHPETFGTWIIGDGESGMNEDIAKRGGLIGYVPEALVYHHIPPSRMTVAYIRKWAWHLGGSQMYARWRNRERFLTTLTKEAILITRQYWRKWLRDFTVRHRRDPAAIDIQFQASLGWCKLAYVWWMLTNAQVQAILDITDFRP